MDEYNDLFLDGIEQEGFAIIDSFLDREQALAIADHLSNLLQKEQFRKAGIGKEDKYQVDQSQRGDYILWIDPLHPESLISPVMSHLIELQQVLNRNFYLGIDHFECHYVHYPVGTHYLRHVDRHKSGSPRVVSFVLYLNEGWRDEDGGQLRIYKRDGSTCDILPQLGRLAVFLSEMEHEVLTTNRVRHSITGWMRQREM